MKSIKLIGAIALFTSSIANASPPLDLFSKRLKSHNISSNDLNNKGGIAVAKGKFNSKVKEHIRGREKATQRVRLRLPNKTLLLDVISVRAKSANRISYSATSSSNTDFVHIAENNGVVVGSVQSDGKLYKLRPAINGETLLIEVDNSQLVDHDKYYTEAVNENLMDSQGTSENNVSSFENLESETEFKVIVAYTDGFAHAAGDVTAFMDLLEEETNTSYENSNINARVTIAHAYQTAYVETGDFYTDRDYFNDANNPETQELSNLRETYRADIMIILTGNDDYSSSCGVAREIGATRDTALALAREGCAAGYYSFGHEIGHLFGARHIITQDSNTSPYANGHGYCNTTSDTWRTVMAYNCPSGTGGPRIQQWSNPNVSIDNDPTGSQDDEFNAFVMNDRIDTVASFLIDNPIAIIDQSSYSIIIGDFQQFTAYGSSDPENLPLMFNWDFGDETVNYQTSQPYVDYTYVNTGTYSLTLSVDNGNRSSDTVNARVTVYDPVTIVTTIITPLLLL